MAPNKSALSSGAFNILSFVTHLILPSVLAASGNPVPISLFTDSTCKTRSVLTPNTSLALSVCAVTPGLGSLTFAPQSCSNGTTASGSGSQVAVWGFTDTACSTQRSIYTLSNYCDGPATAGQSYAAIMLLCDDVNEPGPPVATTTISVGPVATAAATAETTSSPSGAAPPKSGWAAISTGAKVGIVGGGVIVLFFAFLTWAHCTGRVHPPSGRQLDRVTGMIERGNRGIAIRNRNELNNWNNGNN